MKKSRIGEEYNYERLADQIEILELVKDLITLSGGWAWHFMSPPHKEYKHLHDHKDIDIFVKPTDLDELILRLKELGFYRMKTKYDNNDFIRYEAIVNDRKIVIDLFTDNGIPKIKVDGWSLVDPKHLVTLYSSIHGSDKCFALAGARELLNKGINPVGEEELIKLR